MAERPGSELDTTVELAKRVYARKTQLMRWHLQNIWRAAKRFWFSVDPSTVQRISRPFNGASAPAKGAVGAVMKTRANLEKLCKR